MCFSSGSSKPPPPQQPTRFDYLPQQSDVQRQAAAFESQGAVNTANYGSELSSGTPQQSAPATGKGAM